MINESEGSASFAPTPRSTSPSRRPDIQGLRAVAVIMVVVFHSGLPFPGGFVGVDVFFVISGYVITAMLRREWEVSGSIGFGRFYFRRFKRLTPALALMVAVTMAASIFILSPLGPQQTAAKSAIGAIFLVANFVIARTTGGYFDASADTNPLLHTWSLSVEEQFYLIFPALMAIGWILARRRSLSLTPAFLVVFVAIVSFAVAVAGSLGVAIPGLRILMGYYSPVTRAWEFAIGAIAALVLRRVSAVPRFVLTTLGVIGIGMLILSTQIIDEHTPFPGLWTLLPVVGTLALLAAGTESGVISSRLLSSRPMVRVGDWSYSIYLWHWPLIVFAGLLWRPSALVLTGAALVSLLPAVMSYRWVEQPIRNLGPLSPRRKSVLIAVVLVPALVLSWLVGFCVERGWWSDTVRKMQAATLPFHLGKKAGCAERRSIEVAAKRCEWNREATGSPIYLVGDSNADHFSEGVVRAGADLNRPVIISAPSGCPFVDLVLVDSRLAQADNAQCANAIAANLEYLRHADKGLVIISNIDTYWQLESAIHAGISADRLSNEPSAKLEVFGAGLRRTVESLRRDGHQVLLVEPIPHWNDGVWDPARCSIPSIVHGECSAEQSLAAATEEQEPVRRVMRDIASESGASLWDPIVPLCPEGRCSTDAISFTRYRDAGHISVPQSISLSPEIRGAIKAIPGTR